MFHEEELAADNDLAFIELDYRGLNSSLIELCNVELFNNNFKQFFRIVEKQLIKEYGKDIILKVTDYPKNIPFNHIHSKHVNKVYATTAMIKTITQFRLKLSYVMYCCKSCEKEFGRDVIGESIPYPKVCPDCGGKRFDIIFEDSKYEDYKYVKLEEPLENRTNKKFVEFKGKIEGYLASPFYNLNAGDVCNLIFTLSPVIDKKNNTLDAILDIWHIKPVNMTDSEIEISDEDLSMIIDYSLKPDILDIFSKNIATNVVGYESIKKGLTLQLFSGNPYAKRPRENLHCLIIGDPGMGKSLMLDNIYDITPKSVKANGAGTSKAGLTASAVRNELTGTFELEAGAIVLADNGQLILDEFDKLSHQVMLALNEPMEGLSVTINKANIQQTLSANTTILAGANPKNSRFDKMKEIGEQINIPASLLSRFDLIYALTDDINYNNDLVKAKKILSNHDNIDVEVLDPLFIKKYITYAKNNIFPKLSKDAENYIAEFYARTRQLALNDDAKPITTRELGAMYRLAIAHAKVRLSDVVELHDAKVATDVYTESLETLGLDYSTVGSIQNVLSHNESSMLFFMEQLVKSGEYSVSEIIDLCVEEYDAPLEKVEKLYTKHVRK